MKNKRELTQEQIFRAGKAYVFPQMQEVWKDFVEMLFVKCDQPKAAKDALIALKILNSGDVKETIEFLKSRKPYFTENKFDKSANTNSAMVALAVKICVYNTSKFGEQYYKAEFIDAEQNPAKTAVQTYAKLTARNIRFRNNTFTKKDENALSI